MVKKPGRGAEISSGTLYARPQEPPPLPRPLLVVPGLFSTEIHDAKLGYAAGFVQLLYAQRSCLEGAFEEGDILLRMDVTL